MLTSRPSFWRRLSRQKGYLAASVGLLGLAIALSVGAWSAVDASLLGRHRALSRNHVFRVVSDHLTGNVSYPDLLDLQRRLRAAEIIGINAFPHVSVTVGDEPQLERAVMVTRNYFDTLAIPLLAGTGWSATAGAGEADGVIVSEAFARRYLGAPSTVVGTSLAINGTTFTIIGVVAAHTHGLDALPANLWLTLEDGAEVANKWTLTPASRGMSWVETWARVPGGKHQRQAAEAELQMMAASLQAEFPRVRADARFVLQPSLRALWQLDPGALLWVFTTFLVALTLLGIAVCNAGILAALHVLRRSTEFQIRLSLGATRQQLENELHPAWLSLLVGTASVAALAALGGLYWVEAQPNWELAETLLRYGPRWYSVVAGAVLLSLPAVAAVAGLQVVALARTDTSQLIHAPRHSTANSGLTRWLLLLQGTLAVALTVLAGVHLKSARAALAVDPGFPKQGLVIVTLDLRELGFEKAEALGFWQHLLEAMRQHPLVAAAGVGNRLPLAGLNTTRPSVDGREAAQPAGFTVVSPGYFDALGQPRTAGRDFLFTDTDPNRPVVAINESLAAQLWPGLDPLGRFLVAFPGTPPAEVIGLVKDVRPDFRRAKQPALYVPLTTSFTHRSFLFVRLRAAEDDAPATVEALLREHAPDLPPRAVMTFEQFLLQATLELQAAARSLTLLAYASIVLIFAGTYAVFAYVAAQRRQELAVRVALGASPLQLLLAEAKAQAPGWALSVALGTTLGVSAVSMAEDALLLTPAFDPVVVVAGAAALIGVSLASLALALWVQAPRDLAAELNE